MSATLQDPLPVTPKPGSAPEAQVRQTIRQLLADLYPPAPPLDRRRDVRYPFPQLIRLTPVGPDGQHLEMRHPIVVIGKHISERGLAFYHQEPLPYRRAIISFETRQKTWVAFLIDLNWCRFNKLGWYEGGGRLLQRVDTATAA